jgi:hypothetical protein
VIASLIELAGTGAYGLSVICGGEVRAARWSVRTTGGPISLGALGLSESLWPQRVTADVAERIETLASIHRSAT